MKHRGHRLCRQKTHLKIQAEKRQLPLSCTFVQAVVHRLSQMRLRLLLSVITVTILLCWKKTAGGFKPDYILRFRSIEKSPGDIYPVGRTEKIRTGLFLFSPPDREHDRCIFPLLALQLQGKGRSSGRRKDCPYLGDGGYALYRNESL